MAYRPGGKSRWLQRLKGLGIEFIVVDVGPGHGVFSLDVMLAADIPIAVTLPEPPAIETTYRFLRAVYRRRLRRSLGRDRFRLGLLDRAVLDMGMLPSPMDLVRVLVKVERALAEIAWQEAQRMRFQLVVNEARVRTDMEFGSWMSTAVNRHYGIRLDELGHIEHDDAVWLAVRRGKPLLVESPTSKAGRNLERIARRVLALTATRLDPRGPSSPFPTTEPTLYAVLGLARTSTDEEVRRAHKRQREIYAPGSLVTASLLNEAEHKAALLRLGEAFETLLDPVRRRAYDLSMFPDEPTPVMVAEPTRPGLAAEQLMLQRELQREIGPDTEFTGALLRKVRESLGVELADVTLRTKIARLHLQAMEDETYELLPPMVYVRGFVAELAKYLKLDALQVQKTYMRRMRENHPVQTKGEG
jgi:flagellar biosynthesis protein FlhG